MLTVQGTIDTCKVAAASNLAGYTVGSPDTITGPFGALVIDGYAVQLNDRVLVLGQTVLSQNGVFTCTVQGGPSTSSVLTRSTAAADALIPGLLVFVSEGTVNGNTSWIQTNIGTGSQGAIIVDTDAVVWSESNAVLYTFLPTTPVWVVQAAAFGVGKAIVTSVSINQTTPTVTTVTYNVTYNNTQRFTGSVDQSLVFGSLDAAIAYYETVIT
jgi:hypothetical protein